MKASDNFELKHKNCKRAVLIFHGLTGKPFEMLHLVRPLYKADFDIYCPCLPGHSGTIADLNKANWKEWYEFGINEYKNLRENYDEVYIAGLCLGAVLALAVAEDFPDVSGIASLSTTLFLDGWKMPWYKFLMPLGYYTLLKYFYSFPESDPYGVKNEQVRKRLSVVLKDNSVTFNCIPMHCVFELLKMSGFTRKKITKITAPIIIIHSEYDDLTNINGARLVYNNISSKNKEFVRLDNSYHMIIVDNEKELVISKIIDFFNKFSTYSKSHSDEIKINKI